MHPVDTLHPSSSRKTSARAWVVLLATPVLALGGLSPATAVNADHVARVVSTNPADNTPHVMNGSVNAITQIGNKIILAGTFTSVSPSGTFTNTADDVVRNRIVAFDATTGVIDASFNPNLGGSANSLDTDGTSVYVGGAFGSVGGNTAIKRVVKLTSAGAVVSTFKAVPNTVVNEVVVRGDRLYVGGAFTSVKSGTVTATRNALAALNPMTGAVLLALDVPFTGVYDPAIGGSTTIKRFDVSADGKRLAAVGNFSTVGTKIRAQLAVLDTSGTTAIVAPWFTNRYDADHNDCAGVFDSFMRDIDFSPDGNYFAVTTTGAFAGGSGSGTLCDTTTRWETNSTGNDPTWTNYTGGDTTYGVAITGGAVYVGGHMRWQNNSFQGDQAGPGAVPREGIAALDPVNGLPLSWNPGRSRGVGAQALFASPAGLWVGSDTTRLGRETHGRVAFLPLADGKTIPTVAPARLPNDLFLAERPATAASGVRYRVNATGPALQATDNGADWTTDNGFVNWGNPADFGSGFTVDATVPASTPSAVFNTERWDATQWDFAVPAGDTVTVRLYFANRCTCTQFVGQRVFDVAIDGVVKLDDFDIVREVGHNVGTMRAFDITSDGTVDIDLSHVVENPLINGIEIITAGAGGGVAADGKLLRRAVDASGSPTGPASTANTALNWNAVRGAFYVNGTVYYGLTDGGFYSRTFNKATGAVGTQTVVNLYDDPETGERIPFAIANLTGMFYDTETHRIYYTLFGDRNLYYRYFTPESQVVGAQTFTGNNDGVDFSTVAGMTLANGNILYGSSADGFLRSAPFAGGAVTDAATVVNSDSSWKYRAIFVPNI